MTLSMYQHVSPTRILSGCGMAREFGPDLEALGCRRAFLVTEKILVELGLVDRVREGLSAGSIEVVGVFDGVEPNSSVALVEAAAEAARAAACDVLVAVGGGSAMDTAKAVNILLTMGGNLLDYQGAQVLTGALRPLVAIPTTAGTGSEVTNVAVIHDRDAGDKVPFVDHHLTPDVAILDPELTISMPARVTAATGMDALTHAVESHVSAMAYPIADAFGLHAIGMIRRALPRAVADGEDLEARSDMLNAATLAGLAFVHAGVGLVHAVSHTLGGLTGLAHGTANSIMLPHGMAFLLDECPDRLAAMGHAFGLTTRGDVAADARAVIQAVVDLRTELETACGLPTTLDGAGVDRGILEEVAARSILDGANIYNRRAPGKADFKAMLERAAGHPGPDLGAG